MTNILLVTGLVAGGVGRHVQGLAAGLVAEGHTVSVACPPVVATQFEIADTGAIVVPVEIGPRPSPRRDRAATAALRAAMAEVDVVHAHGLRAGALSLFARRGEDRPLVVVTSHNAAPRGRVAALIHHGLERKVCHDADLFLGVSEDLIARARERGAPEADRAVVAAARALPETAPEQVRTELGLTDGQRLVVAVGRLTPQKGFDRLLEVIGRIEFAGVDMRVVIAGDGPQGEALQRTIDRRALPVTLLGRRADVADLLGAADLAVSAARWEGQPVWLQEALSVGAPIVATDVGGTAEVLDGGGVLVPEDDPEALAGAMAAVLTDPAHRAELRRRSLRRAEQLPTGEDAVRAALTAYARAGDLTRAPGDVD
ncbi:glycosyltransferase family 4 protein [Ornithinicoccus hortensis]|uniref:Glycosyltransferase involved in cell wall biosynthesis n=1 Tax=Ornithinicoccus hortensis TaxID=82346 RepID=A0A542YSC3_9MICO|nr:glycosyltransferase family 4 protein [Ornithinicoccus hortensis]TQL51003.1 glycosyltransferase involved in cell wall biosynthesis [Ornithinicoccus hortensis]